MVKAKNSIFLNAQESRQCWYYCCEDSRTNDIKSGKETWRPEASAADSLTLRWSSIFPLAINLSQRCVGCFQPDLQSLHPFKVQHLMWKQKRTSTSPSSSCTTKWVQNTLFFPFTDPKSGVMICSHTKLLIYLPSFPDIGLSVFTWMRHCWQHLTNHTDYHTSSKASLLNARNQQTQTVWSPSCKSWLLILSYFSNLLNTNLILTTWKSALLNKKKSK